MKPAAQRDMSTSYDESLRSYNYICQKFGTVEMVRLRRNLYNLWDIIQYSGPSNVQISSGSAVEGFDMIGSDTDIMYMLIDTVVCLSERDAEIAAQDTVVGFSEDDAEIATDITTLVVDTYNTKPCYALLRVPKNVPLSDHPQGLLVHKGQDIFFSSHLFKLFFLNGMSSTSLPLKIHGPCLTTEDDTFDALYCFRCKCWPSQALPWILRSRINHWPSPVLISKIVSFGILFVPVGCKGSINEDIEWRMSFSIAEKLLIYSFNHTQFLCYGLMKLLLKDVIDQNESLKGLLCSYFLKTLLFWLCEETDQDMWKPEKISLCFRACICRLLYCVQYSTLVHYFIPQNNFFENRFEKEEYIQMIGFLQNVRHHGLQCLFDQSVVFSGVFHTLYQPSHNSEEIHSMLFIITTFMKKYFEKKDSSLLILNKINKFSGVKLAVKIIIFLWKNSNNLNVQRDTTNYFNNKLQYKHFKQQQLLLLNFSIHNRFRETGWLFVASFFYRHKRYHIVKELISYVVSRSLKVNALPLGAPYKPEFNKIPAMIILNLLVNPMMFFEQGSALIPEELEIEVTNNLLFTVPIIVYAHFLNFLSNYHLGDFMSYMESLRSLEKNTYGFYRYYPKEDTHNIPSFLCLGIAYEMIGHFNKAQKCFSICISLDKHMYTKAAFRMSKLNK